MSFKKSENGIKEEVMRCLMMERDLYDMIASILYRHDPIGICLFNNLDEYSIEVLAIIPLLQECNDRKELATIIKSIFAAYFDTQLADEFKDYHLVAYEILLAKLKVKQTYA